jgi:ankyrin repeat protein
MRQFLINQGTRLSMAGARQGAGCEQKEAEAARVDRLSSDLLRAAGDDNEELARELIAAGANPKWKDPKTGATALMCAVEREAGRCVRLLLPLSDRWAKDVAGMDALGYADFCSSRAIRALLLDGCDPAWRTPFGRTPLMMAIGLRLPEWGGKSRAEWIAHYAEHGDCAVVSKHAGNALAQAARAGDMGSMRLLWGRGVPSDKSTGGQTLLMWAAEGGSIECMELAMGACGLNDVDAYARNALLHAVHGVGDSNDETRSRAVAFLIEQGANLDQRDWMNNLAEDMAEGTLVKQTLAHGRALRESKAIEAVVRGGAQPAQIEAKPASRRTKAL